MVLVAIFNELPQCHVLANQNAPFGHVVRALSLWAPSSFLYGAFHTFQCGLFWSYDFLATDRKNYNKDTTNVRPEKLYSLTWNRFSEIITLVICFQR